jgi:hypothetical protein
MCIRFAERRQERSGFIHILLSAKEQIGDDVRINDGFQERPAVIQASTSRAPGRRL